MQNNKEVKDKIVQTYAEDMAEVIQGSKDGLIKEIIHSEATSDEEKVKSSPESLRNKIFILVGAVLVLVSAGTWFYFFSNKGVLAPIFAPAQFIPLVYSDKSITLGVDELKKEEIIIYILGEAEKTQLEIKENKVAGIYLALNKRNIGLRKFIELMKGSFVPGSAVFVPDGFMMGVVGGKTDTSVETMLPEGEPTPSNFFILLKMRSLVDIFDALRIWESKMFTDLGSLFGTNLSEDTKYLATKPFENIIIKNKNARALTDREGGTVLMYTFVDDNFVVFTNTVEALDEVMGRIATSRVKK